MSPRQRTRHGYPRDLVPPVPLRPRTLDPELVAAELDRLAKVWPVGARVRHVGGRTGYVALDEAVRAPGMTAGKPTAWCLRSSGESVCVAWNNDQGVRWLVWVPSHTLRLTGGRR